MCACDDRVCRHEADGRIGEVHRAAFATIDTVSAAHELGHDADRIHSLQNGLAVAAVCGEDQVALVDGVQRSRLDRFLSNAADAWSRG